jgi:hypothetical protein
VDHGTVPVHGGLMMAQRQELTGAQPHCSFQAQEHIEAVEKWREAAVVLTDSFGGLGGDEGRSATEKHGGGAWSSVSWCLRSRRVKLGWAVSAVRQVEGLGTFYMERSRRRREQPAAAQWSFNGATVLGGGENGKG